MTVLSALLWTDFIVIEHCHTELTHELVFKENISLENLENVLISTDNSTDPLWIHSLGSLILDSDKDISYHPESCEVDLD